MSEAAAATPGRLEPEDQARADFYALLARLFSGPPDAGLLRAIASAPPLAPSESMAGGDELAARLAAAWSALRSASASVDAEAASDEYQTLFVGVGRSEVSLYASHYVGPQSGRPLAEIRAALAELGLARRPAESEFEDHLALILETMRMLVAGDAERPPAEISAQRRFFDRYLMPWAPACCTAIEDSSVANYYRRVAQFSRCFVEIEEAAFAIA
jgi:TorA maturation chaperone TorD